MFSKNFKTELGEMLLDIISEYKYIVAAIFVQGSQNYNLDIYTEDYKSDLDIKCFVYPTFDDIYEAKKISFVVKTRYGQAEIKDIRLLSTLISEANPAYLELMYTKYNIIYDEAINYLKDKSSTILDSRKQRFLNAMAGNINQKMTAIFKPRNGNIEEFAKFGYSAKDLHHLVRLTDALIEVFKNGVSFKDSLFVKEGERRDYLIKLKTVKLDIEEVKNIAMGCISITNDIIKEYRTNIKDEEISHDIALVNSMIKNEIIKLAKIELMQKEVA